jgi:multiple antibiotic resistance protein
MTSGFALYTFVTLFAMLNPVEAGAAFATLAAHRTAQEQRSIALRASVVAGIILLGFGVAGEALFKALGISLAAFRIAGGLLLLKVGFDMVFAQNTDTSQAEDSKHVAHPSSDPAVFPLAIPIITGPGALTAIVTLLSKPKNDMESYAFIFAAAVVVLILTYFAMIGSESLTKVLGSTGIDAVGRVVGVVVAALAVQLIIDGVLEVWNTATRGA